MPSHSKKLRPQLQGLRLVALDHTFEQLRYTTPASLTTQKAKLFLYSKLSRSRISSGDVFSLLFFQLRCCLQLVSSYYATEIHDGPETVNKGLERSRAEITYTNFEQQLAGFVVTYCKQPPRRASIAGYFEDFLRKNNSLEG
jgi:hypothetical protein